MTKPENTNAYISGFPPDIQALLQQIRATIMEAAPEASEVISYGLPAFKLNGMLVWIAAHTHHIGFYPRASAIAAFKKELANYKNAKGSVQFPFNQPLPVNLVKAMVKFRVTENLERGKRK